MHRFWGLVFGVVLLGIFVSTAIGPWFGWWVPMSASSYSGDIDNLLFLIFGVVAVFYVLTEALLVINIFRSGAPGRKAQFTHGSTKLEIVWTVIPAIILVTLAVIQIRAWAHIKYPSRLAERIKDGELFLQIGAEARQWEFRFRYPSPKRLEEWKANPTFAKDDFAKRMPERLDDVHVGNDVHVWKGQKVLLHFKTRDVGHSVFFPQLRLKQDAMPGKTIPVWFEATVANTKKIGDAWKIGIPEGTNDYDIKHDFDLVCTQYCGTRHSLMRGKLYVHANEADFVAWLKHAQSISDSRGGNPSDVAVAP
jgi:cytochrome c oxidase subunit II